MKLKQLKSLLDQAASKLASKPDDEALKAAHATALANYNAAKAEADEEEEEDEDDDTTPPGEGGEDDDDEDEPEVTDEKTKKYIKKLRAESAKHRTKNKTLENRLGKLETGLKGLFGEGDDNEPSEKKLEKLQGQAAAVSFRAAILESAVDNGIVKDQLEYYEFLISKAAEKLGEDEELSAEDLAEIAEKVKAAGGSGGGSKIPKTGAGGSGKNPPKPGAADGVTLDQFCDMSFGQRQDLCTKNPTLYNALFQEAVKKRRL